jgi:hypothetical protein
MMSLNAKVHAMPRPAVKSLRTHRHADQPNAKQAYLHMLAALRNAHIKLVILHPCIDDRLDATAPPSHNRTVFSVGFLGS